MDFRKDINALRALAVISVVLYHFGVKGFSGGFVGVDVFFVISGYLMTAIILTRAVDGSFSLLDFYLARARRILPALTMTCAVVLVFGWFWLIPTAYKQLGKEVASAMTFLSNFHFKQATDYFSASNDNWLLHTWSLSVEWQFYLIYPMLLLAGVRWLGASERKLLAMIGLGCMASFVYCIILSGQRPSSAFYFLPTRAWEMLAGGLVLMMSRHYRCGSIASRLLVVAGLLMIATAVMLFDGTMLWPGYAALLPVAGTCLVILAAWHEAGWADSRILASIGTWSYSIYLVHWPIVVGMAYFGVKHEPVWVFLGILSTMVLGAASFRFVELPARRVAGRWSRTTSMSLASLLVLVVVLPSSAIYAYQGISARVPEAVRIADAEKENTHRLVKCNTKDRINLPECILGASEIRAVVWGDSHVSATGRAIGAAAESTGGGVKLYYKAGCPVVFGARAINASADPTHACERFNNAVLERLQDKHPSIPVIVITRASQYMDQVHFEGSDAVTPEQRASMYAARLEESLCRIASNRPVYVVRPIPEMSVDVPKVMALNLMLHGKAEDVFVPASEYQARHKIVLETLERTRKRCGVELLDPAPYLCTDGKCWGSVNGRPLYTDSTHLSEYGNRRLIPMFRKVFENRPA